MYVTLLVVPEGEPVVEQSIMRKCLPSLTPFLFPFRIRAIISGEYTAADTVVR